MKKNNREEDNQNADIKYMKMMVLIGLTFMIMVLFFSGYSFAKYVEQRIIQSNTQIAEPILEIENNDENIINISENESTGEYQFKIKNFKFENQIKKVTDVDMKYYIEIQSQGDDVLKMKLFENDKEIPLINNKSGYINICKNTPEERIYKIKVFYDKEEESKKEINQTVQIKVHSEQS